MYTGYWQKILPADWIPIRWHYIARAMFMKQLNYTCYLNMLAYKGELEKTTTFKDKVRLQPENVNAGLLTYPVLQTADIIFTGLSLVPVGKDQEQHLEMARNFANRFNHRYGEVFPEPYAFNFGRRTGKSAQPRRNR